MGRFVANGTRNLDGLTNPDPVQRELDWYARQPEPQVQAPVGTVRRRPGRGHRDAARQRLHLQRRGQHRHRLPGRVGAAGHRRPPVPATQVRRDRERLDADQRTLRILGMTLFEPDAVMVAVRASYEIPKVVKVNIPFSAYYPLAGSGLAWFIRLGTDNHPDRPGSPITVTLFPSLLNIKAWAFLMIEERQLHGLGGTLVPPDMLPVLDFDGYSIGMGAGFELR